MRLIDNPSKDYVEMQMDPVVGPLAVAQDPAGVRSALRKLGVERIAAQPDATGWTFEGLCNLSRLVSNKGGLGLLRSLTQVGLRGLRPRTNMGCQT